MTNILKEKYYVKKSENGEWQDITVLCEGVRILSITGFNERGEAINIYNEQWVNEPSQTEDFVVTTIASNEPVVVRKNVDLEMTFAVSKKYATTAIDVQSQHDMFVNYMLGSDVYLKSKYTDKEVHCVALDSYKPTICKLQRGFESFIMGTIKFHTLTKPETSVEPVIGDVYIGFGASAINHESDIPNLLNVQHYNKSDAAGTYTIVCPSTSYLWICTRGTISYVSANGFQVPMEAASIVGEYRCYRTSNSILAHTMSFTVETT